MNVGIIIIGLIMIFAASISIVAMASNASEPVTDTMGHTHNERTNATEQTIINASGTVAETGGDLGLAIAVVLVAGTLFAVLGLILYYKRGNSGYGNR
jgi:hypothetical protein